MKAFVLAAGLGTRLGALTRETPKCLLPVGGLPILEWDLRLLERAGVTEVLINTHHLPEPVRAFARARRGGAKLSLVHEPELLGSAGTLFSQRDFVRGERSFWALYADTLIGGELEPIAAVHRAKTPVMTMGLFRAPDPKACGIAELDEDGLLVSFEEKPAAPRSDLAAAGVFLFDASVFDALGTGVRDVGTDLVPRLVGRSRGVELAGPVLDIGTPAAYERVRDNWPPPVQGSPRG